MHGDFLFLFFGFFNHLPHDGVFVFGYGKKLGQ